MKIYYFFFISFYYSITFAQAPAMQWQKRIGGDDWQVSASSQQTLDNGFIIIGSSNSNISFDKTENSRGSYDYWMVKTDENGTIQWDKTIGGLSDDPIRVVRQTPDGGYILCGVSHSVTIGGDKTEAAVGNSPDFWIVKTNATGSIEWQNVIGGTSEDDPFTLEVTADGGYIVGGLSRSNISGDKTENNRGLYFDYWVLKLDSTGNIIWQKTIGGDSADTLSSIIETSDGGYLLGGYSSSGISAEKTESCRGGFDYWVIKLDNIGNIIWQKTIGGTDTDYLSKVIQCPDGGYVLAGYSRSTVSGDKTEANKGVWNFWVVKINESGVIEWQKVYGGNADEELLAATKCTDGGYIFTGSSTSGIFGDKTEANYGGYDAWVVKTDSIGTILWEKSFGGNGSDGFNSVVQTTDGGYFLSAGTDSSISGTMNLSPKGIFDYWILKLAPDNLSINENEIFENLFIQNPITTSIEINSSTKITSATLILTDILGKIIFTKNNQTIEANYTIPISVSKGMYLLTIKSENRSAVKKLIKV
jgi:Secretion system C-terminal sorting domain